jgi:hypothetical protein
MRVSVKLEIFVVYTPVIIIKVEMLEIHMEVAYLFRFKISIMHMFYGMYICMLR